MDYHDYLQSNEWKRRRKIALKFWNHKCSLCNGGKNLDVHHRTYERLGKENLNDLIVLCRSCHKLFHDRQSSHERPEHINAPLFRILQRVRNGLS